MGHEDQFSDTDRLAAAVSPGACPISTGKATQAKAARAELDAVLGAWPPL